MSAPRYEIRELKDFLKVPEDRLDACLAEFAVALRLQHTMGDVVNAVLQDMTGMPDTIDLVGRCFTWIDDDEKTMEVSITVAQEEPA